MIQSALIQLSNCDSEGIIYILDHLYLKPFNNVKHQFVMIIQSALIQLNDSVYFFFRVEPPPIVRRVIPAYLRVSSKNVEPLPVLHTPPRNTKSTK